MVFRLYFLMQNNHDVSSIELVCLYPAKSHNSIHYITAVIRLHFLMQNNHVMPSIELLCLYLAKSHNSTHYITVVISLHFFCTVHRITVLIPGEKCKYYRGLIIVASLFEAE